MFQLPENSKAVGLRPCNPASECIPYLVLASLSGSHFPLSSFVMGVDSLERRHCG
jgi:hypothetical protein